MVVWTEALVFFVWFRSVQVRIACREKVYFYTDFEIIFPNAELEDFGMPW